MNRLRVAASALLGILVVSTTAVSAHADTTLTVSVPDVAGDAPGGLIRSTGTGFTPGLRVRVTVTDEDGSAPLPIATVVADATGQVVLPTTARTPLSTPVGPALHLTMTGTDGVTATSGGFGLEPPTMSINGVMVSGQPALNVYLYGLSTRPDAVRTVSIDGQPISGITWYSDARSFAWPGVSVPVPATLLPGDHTVTFRQTGPTPFQKTLTTTINAPVIYTTNTIPHDVVTLQLDNTGWDDVLDVTIVDAAGARHTAGPLTIGGSDHDYGVFPVSDEGYAIGTATVTTVSRHNGATASATFRINGPTVTAGLAPDERLASLDGRFVLKMQTDGNLVLYRDTVVVWTSRTTDNTYAGLTILPDGNVQIRNGWANVAWTTSTSGVGAGTRFGLDQYGDVSVFSASGREAYSTFQYGPKLFPSLAANRYLFRGQALTHALTSGSVTFTMQSDGNAVVSQDGWIGRWSTGTAGHPNAYLLLQNDGALVVRAANGATLWSNGVRAAGAKLVAQSDGNIVEYAPNGKALWSSRTAIQR